MPNIATIKPGRYSWIIHLGYIFQVCHGWSQWCYSSPWGITTVWMLFPNKYISTTAPYGFKHVSNIISIYLILPWMKHNAWRDQIIFCSDQNGPVQQTEWWEWWLLYDPREGPLQISVSISIESLKVVCWSIQKGGDWGSQPISFCSRAASGLQRKV